MKEGYEPFVMVFGTIKLAVTANGVTFAKAVTAKLGYPSYVTLYIDKDKKMLAIKPAKKDDKNAVAFYRPNDRDIAYVRMNNTDLLNYLCLLMDWNLKEHSYVVKGAMDYKEKLIEFDLKGYEIK